MDYSILIGVRRERFRVMNRADMNGEDVVVRATEIDDDLRLTTVGGGSVGVVDAFRREPDGAMKALMVDGPGFYYAGIIDILQEWNWKKRIERYFKVYLKRLDGNGLSAIQPTIYAQRFWKRCVLDTFEGLEDKVPSDVFGAEGKGSNDEP
jgi:1-phosphatidylinositol-4-phosphate 5-kinase